MAENKSTADRGRNPQETMEMDRSPHTLRKAKPNITIHKRVAFVEPTRKEEKRTATEQLAVRCRGRDEEDGLYVGTAGGTGSGSFCLAETC